MKNAVLAAIFLAQLALAKDIQLKLVWRDLPHSLEGQKVQITQNDQTVSSGVLIGLDSVGLTQNTRPGAVTIPRASILTIQTHKKLVRIRGRLLGTAIGCGIGVAILATVLTFTHNEGGVNTNTLNGAAAGLAAGFGALGYLAGNQSDRDRTIIQVVPEPTVPSTKN